MIPLTPQAIKTGFNVTLKALVKAAPTIGVIFGVGLMTGATVKTGLEAPKLKEDLEELDEKTDISHKDYLKAKARILAYHLGLPVVMTLSGMAMIFGGYKIKYTQATIATAALASQTEETKKLKNKFLERYGPKEYEKLKDDITKDDVLASPINFSTIINTGHGNMLCWDPIFHDYYWSDLEFIRSAAEEINDEMSNHWAQLRKSAVNYNTWRRNIGLPESNEHPNSDVIVNSVDLGKDIGWFNRRIKLKITAVLLPDDNVVHVIGFTDEGAPKWRLDLEDEDRADYDDYDETDGHQRYAHLKGFGK